ncbi:hypothetical protein IWQ61_007000 [Dispira simplex]|nr:hypothetical protein IWQ61_007000 [Dispira simplex]
MTDDKTAVRYEFRPVTIIPANSLDTETKPYHNIAYLHPLLWKQWGLTELHPWGHVFYVCDSPSLHWRTAYCRLTPEPQSPSAITHLRLAVALSRTTTPAEQRFLPTPIDNSTAYLECLTSQQCSPVVRVKVEIKPPTTRSGLQALDKWGGVQGNTLPQLEHTVLKSILRGILVDTVGVETCHKGKDTPHFKCTVAEGTALKTGCIGLGTEIHVTQSDLSHPLPDSGETDFPPTPDSMPTGPLSHGEELPGLEMAYKNLRDLLVYPLRHASLFSKLGIQCPKGLLLHGPPGVGKTWLVTSLARECNATLKVINGPEIFGAFIGESEQRLRDIFQEAQGLAIELARPCVLFIDEIDALAPNRDDAHAHESRVIAQLLTLMDGLTSRGRLVVIAATNRPNAIDPALRRPGRFDREVAIGVPNQSARHSILQFYTKIFPLARDVDLAYLAQATNGYVGADLAALCREAGAMVIRRTMDTLGISPGPNGTHTMVPVSMDDFRLAMKKVGPSMQRGLEVEVTPTTWDDIGGLATVKTQLQQAVTWPTLYPDTFRRLGLHPPTGILLYGPPGCSKTTLVKAIASQMCSSFFSLNGAALYSPYVGDSEKVVRDIFQRARAGAPSVLFFDEIDTIVGKRQLGQASGNSGHGGDVAQERILTMLLNEMDGVETNHALLIIGATNRPDMMDAALLRPGRFDRLVYVPPPDYSARVHILTIATRSTPLASDVNLPDLAERTERFSGADLANLCREAALAALREDHCNDKVSMRHYLQVLANASPSISSESLAWFEQYNASLRQT